MTATEIQELAVTDQVRKGAVYGSVIWIARNRIAIAWDDAQRDPVSYSKSIDDLKDVTVVRKAPQASFEGQALPGYYR
jgi:hypothetical protein